jgi:hypothetical protein
MSYTSTATDLAFTGSKSFAPTKIAAAKRGFFARLLDVLMTSRMRQAEREIAQFISLTGGKFTDEAEREIERRFLSSSSRW